MSSQPIKSKKKSNSNIYMSNKIKNTYYKVPLVNYIKVKDDLTYKKQKSPHTLGKEFRDDNENGYNTVCFIDEFQRPKTDFNNIIRYIEKENLQTGEIEKKPVYKQYLGETKYKLKKNEGYSILTGAKNKLLVIDLDIKDWTNENKFINYCCEKLELEIKDNVIDNVINIVKNINTYTVKSPNGFHLYFHSKNAQNISNSANSKENVDIRGEGGLIIGAYTQLKKPNGDIVEYTPYIDKELLDITDKTNMDFIDLFDEISSWDNKNKKNIDKSNRIKKYKNRPLEPRLYEYLFTDKQLDKLEALLPDKFFIDFMEWKKLTMFYAKIDRKDRWKKISYEKRFISGVDKYDEINNEYHYNLADNDKDKYLMVEYVLKACGLMKDLPYHKYKKIPANIIKPDDVFDNNRVSDYFYEDTQRGIYKSIFEKNKLEGQNLVIKSGTATGKSYFFKHYHSVKLDRDIPIMSIVSRVSLAEEHQRIFEEYDKDLYDEIEREYGEEFGIGGKKTEDDVIIQNPDYQKILDENKYNEINEKIKEIKKKINLNILGESFNTSHWGKPYKTYFDKDKAKVYEDGIIRITIQEVLKYFPNIGFTKGRKTEYMQKNYEYFEEEYNEIIKQYELKDELELLEDALDKSRGKYFDCEYLDVAQIKYEKRRKYYLYNKIHIPNYCGSNLIIQVDSLLKLQEWSNEILSEYVIFIDEFNSVFEYLMLSDTLKNKRRQVFKLFSRILKNAKQVIMCDADITDTALMYLNMKYWELCGIKLTEEEKETYNLICPNIEFKYIENKHKHYKGVDSEELFNYELLVEQLSKLDKFMVCCDSRDESLKLKVKLMEKGLKDKDITVICSATDIINKDLDKYKQVIFSPSIVYGLDSQMQREVFCIMTEKSITSRGMLQQVARCRNITKLWYYFPYKKDELAKGFNFNNQDEVVNRVIALNNYSTNRFKEIIKEVIITENMNFEEVCNEYDILNNTNGICNSFFMNLLNRIIYFDDCDASNKFLHFKLGLRRLGYNDKELMKDLQDRDRAEQKKLKKLVGEQVKEMFINNMNTESVKELNKILKLPNDEEKIKYYQIFCESGAFDKHIAFCNLYLENSDNVSKKLNDSYEKEFGSHLCKTTLNKVNYIKKLFNKIDLVENNLYGDNELTENEANKLYSEYNLIWKNRKTKIKTNPFLDKFELGKFLKDAIKDLVGFSPYKAEQIKTYIIDKETNQKKRVSRTDYTLDKLSQEFAYHFKLKEFRIIKEEDKLNNQEILYIEDD